MFYVSLYEGLSREDLEKKTFDLEQENKRLKQDLKWKNEVAEISTNSYNKEKEKSALYKEVIEEVREYIKENLSFCENDSQGLYEKCNIRIASDKKLLQILDKARENK